MSDRHMKVIGYFAYSGQEVVCTDGVACLVSGSPDAMERYLLDLGGGRHTIKKTRFGEIMKGLSLGAAYAFDEESYGRFYPHAIAEGLAVSDPSAFQKRPTGSKFLTVQIKK